MADLEREVHAACKAGLRARGFALKKGVYVATASGGLPAGAWLGLNEARSRLPAELGLAPVVGIVHPAVEANYLELVGEGERPKPTLTVPLGYLMPEQSFRQWFFRAGEPLEPVVAELVEAVTTYGVPWVEQQSDWDRFVRELPESRWVLEHERALLLPVVWALDGRVEEAVAAVEAERAAMDGRDDMYAEGYVEFAERFLTWAHQGAVPLTPARR